MFLRKNLDEIRQVADVIQVVIPFASLCIAIYHPGYPVPIIALSICVLAFVFRFIIYLANKWLYRMSRSSNPGQAFVVRRGDKYDAGLIHGILLRSFSDHTGGDSDITETSVFRGWLEDGRVLFFIVTQVDSSNTVLDAVGFYSIHPLTPTAFKKLKSNQLHHDSISNEHLVQLAPGQGREHSDEEVCLFILDVESVSDSGRPNQRVGSVLLYDLIAQVDTLITHNNVRTIAALGASKWGTGWSETLKLRKVGHDYWPHLHGRGWHIYEVDSTSVREQFTELHKLGLPPSLEHPYPHKIDREAIEVATLINILLETKRSRDSANSPQRRTRGARRGSHTN